MKAKHWFVSFFSSSSFSFLCGNATVKLWKWELSHPFLAPRNQDHNHSQNLPRRSRISNCRNMRDWSGKVYNSFSLTLKSKLGFLWNLGFWYYILIWRNRAWSRYRFRELYHQFQRRLVRLGWLVKKIVLSWNPRTTSGWLRRSWRSLRGSILYMWVVYTVYTYNRILWRWKNIYVCVCVLYCIQALRPRCCPGKFRYK